MTFDAATTVRNLSAEVPSSVRGNAGGGRVKAADEESLIDGVDDGLPPSVAAGALGSGSDEQDPDRSGSRPIAGVAGVEQPPLVIGRYAIHDKIASGGMATVHLGRMRGQVGFARTVAIKRLHAQYAADPKFVAMFLDEARLVARISHPNVVPTHDVVADDGELFLVMEYVKGESLSRLLRVAGDLGVLMPPAMATSLMIGVLHGLHAAHEATDDRGEPLHIVHRDVSPQNVIVGVDGIARVLDFGVAKAYGRLQTTSSGELKGKLPYMPPEQLRGETSRATDIYAASVVLWETLTGMRLFTGENEPDVMTKILQGCRTAPGELVPGLPPELDAVVLRGLSAKPEDRFSTAREMARALAAAMPVVDPSTAGEWVEKMATAALDERSARIATLEAKSAPSVRTPNRSTPVPGRVGASGSSRPLPIRALAVEDFAIPRDEGSMMAVGEDSSRIELTTGALLSSQRAGRDSRGLWGACVVAAAVTALVVGMVSARGSSAAHATAASAPTGPAQPIAAPLAALEPGQVNAPPVSPPSPAPESRASAPPSATKTLATKSPKAVSLGAVVPKRASKSTHLAPVSPVVAPVVVAPAAPVDPGSFR